MRVKGLTVYPKVDGCILPLAELYQKIQLPTLAELMGFLFAHQESLYNILKLDDGLWTSTFVGDKKAIIRPKEVIFRDKKWMAIGGERHPIKMVPTGYVLAYDSKTGIPSAITHDEKRGIHLDIHPLYFEGFSLPANKLSATLLYERRTTEIGPSAIVISLGYDPGFACPQYHGCRLKT